MAVVRLSAEARSDYDEIMGYLERVGGIPVAEQYRLDFIVTLDQLAAFLGAGAPRKKLGAVTRLLVVSPYSIYYDGRPKGASVLILRIVRGSKTEARRIQAACRAIRPLLAAVSTMPRRPV